MPRSEIWKQCVKSLIQNLLDAPSAAAREVGKVWQWAFSRLDEHPDDFNLLQDSSPEAQIHLIKEFLTACEQRAEKRPASDQKMVQYAIEKSLPISEAPVTAQMSQEVADALATFGMFLGHRGHNTIDAPSRFPYTAALFGFHEQVFKDLLESKQVPEAQRRVLEEVAKHVPKGKIQEEYFRRCEAAARIETLFGFSKRLLTATEVYQRGLEFYRTSSRVGPKVTVTFSNTSGLWNPLERYGTAEFVRRYGITTEAKVDFKDGFRSTNFVDGILNPALACRRLYLFNDANTWDAFRKARTAARDVGAFDADAKRLVEEVCVRMEATTGGLHLARIGNWSAFPPLALVTRVSSEIIMFSNRGSDFAISHAFWCALSESGRKRKQMGGRVSTVLKAVGEMASGGLLSVLASLAPFLESLLRKTEYFEKIQERVAGERMRRLLDEEPAQVLSELEERFGLDVEYLTPQMLRAQLCTAIGQYSA